MQIKLSSALSKKQKQKYPMKKKKICVFNYSEKNLKMQPGGVYNLISAKPDSFIYVLTTSEYNVSSNANTTLGAKVMGY